METYSLNDTTSPLSLLSSRRSTKARNLVAPGPSAEQLSQILKIASRVPDHGKLAPWRFIVIDDRAAFSALLQRLCLAANPAATQAEADALDAFARQAPALVALVSVPKESQIPLYEQQLSAGAAGLALLLGAHAHGFVGCWLTGAAANLQGVADALGIKGGRIAGFFFLGTPAKSAEERPRPDPALVVSHWPA